MRVAVFANDVLGARVLRLIEASGAELVYVAIPDLSTPSSRYELRRCSPIPLAMHTRAWSEDQVAAYQKSSPTLAILAWWPYLLSPEVLAVPQTTVNLHPGMLPDDPGMDPYFWAMVEGRPYGVTLHVATAELDAGPVIDSSAVSYDWTDTGQDLLDRGIDEMVRLLARNLPSLLVRPPEVAPQRCRRPPRRRGEISVEEKIDIDQSTTARELFNLLRARQFSSAPPGAAYFEDQGFRYLVSITIERCESPEVTA